MEDSFFNNKTVLFGFWKDKPLEWRIVQENEDDLLLCLAYGIHTMPYDANGHFVEWETSAPRRFLYDVFLPQAFTKTEAERIVRRSILMEKDVCEPVPQQYAIEERIFLLSEKEIRSSGNDPAFWIRRLDARAEGSSFGAWWLRSFGRLENLSMGVVRPDGVIYPSGDIRARNVMIVPAIYVK